jgi:hypothetical protein
VESMSEAEEAEEDLVLVGWRLEDPWIGEERGGREACGILRRGTCDVVVGDRSERDRSESAKRKGSDNILVMSSQLGTMGKEERKARREAKTKVNCISSRDAG